MPYLTLEEARSKYRLSKYAALSEHTAARHLRESFDAFAAGRTYDIFLSHSFQDAQIIAGIKMWLEEQGQTVYVDWIDDAHMDREQVTAATAAILRERLKASRSLLFATSEASPRSKWMPWELGFFDGFRPNRVAILPVVAVAGDTFVGQEYLGLYPTVNRISELGGRVMIQKAAGSREVMGLSDFSGSTPRFKQF